MGKKAGLTAEDVIDTAAGIADREGLGNVTLSRLAKDLAIRPPSLYNHVDGLDGLRRDLAFRASSDLHDAFTKATSGLEGEDAIRSAAAAYRKFASDHPGLYESLILGRQMRADPALGEVTVEMTAPILQTFEKMGLGDTQKYNALRMFRAALHGYMVFELEAGSSVDLDSTVEPERDETFNTLVQVLIQGLHQI